MLKLINLMGEEFPLTKYKDLSIESVLSYGDKTLSFTIPIAYGENIREECYIQTESDEFVIKELDISDDEIKVKASLNIEELDGAFLERFDSTEHTIVECMNLALVGTNWTVTSTITKYRTIAMTDCTPWDIVKQVVKTYAAELEIDSLNKALNFADHIGSDRGVYFTDQLNLTSLSIGSDTHDYYTRLIPTGKDGLTIESVNYGKNYVENHQYSDKIRTLHWKDEKYTVAQNLKDDAVLKLADLSKPYRTYSCNIVDLAKSGDYDILEFSIGDTVTIMDSRTGTKEKQRIVKITEYPDDYLKNTCELANTVLSFEEMASNYEDTVSTVNNVTVDNGTVDGSTVDGISTSQIYDFDTAIINHATITNLTANYATISGELTVVQATVGTLEATMVTTNYLETNYAQIDLANVAMGSIGTALIATGAIATAQIADGSITDAKINDLTANKITAGTLNAALITVTNLDCASLTVGQINGVQIADNAISTDKLTQALNDIISEASSNASNAVTTANGKNRIYYTSSQPSGGTYNNGDIWFDTDDDYKMYVYNSGAFTASQFGTDAIANLSITTALIAEGAITDAKISTLDAGKINTGTLSADRIAANSIAAGKLLIGANGGLCINSGFDNWTGAYPAGMSIWSYSDGVSKQVVNGKNLLQMVCDTTQQGITISASSSAAGFFTQNLTLDGVEYLNVEIKFRLSSGTSASGACFLLDFYYKTSDGTQTSARVSCILNELGTLTTNTWYTYRKIIQIPSVVKTNQFVYIAGYLFGNYTTGGTLTTKTIQFTNVNVYPATQQDYLTQTWTMNQTYINGGNIYTGTVTATQIASRTITADKIVAHAITANEIAASTITANEISANTITAAKMNITSLSAITANLGTVTSGIIQSGNYSPNVSGTKMSLTDGTIDTKGFKVSSAGTIMATVGTIGSFTLNGGSLVSNTSGVAYTSSTPEMALIINSITDGTGVTTYGRKVSLKSSGLEIVSNRYDGFSDNYQTGTTIYGEWEINLTAPLGRYSGMNVGTIYNRISAMDYAQEVGEADTFGLVLSSGSTNGGTDYGIYLMGDTSINGDLTINSNRIYMNSANASGFIQLSPQQMYFNPSAQEIYVLNFGVRDNGWRLCPDVHATMSLGSPSSRWTEVWANNGTIQTSDRNDKNNIRPLDVESSKGLILRSNPVSYKMNDGTSGRTHYGLIAQDVEELLNAFSIPTTDFAGFIRYDKKIMIESTDSDGNKIRTEQSTGDYGYALRYEEFIAPLIKTVQYLYSEIESLKAQL